MSISLQDFILRPYHTPLLWEIAECGNRAPISIPNYIVNYSVNNFITILLKKLLFYIELNEQCASETSHQYDSFLLVHDT